MRSEAPALVPIFRSRHQADLLAAVLLHPDQDYTISGLARWLNIPLTTLQREVQRLIEADIITARQVGRTKLLRANSDNRVVHPLTELLITTIGPHIVVAEEFGGIAGAEQVVIYGSWAARYHGAPGPPPHDIDVLVIGEVDRGAIYEAADRAEQRLRLPVNPTIRSPRRWVDNGDPLVQQIRSAPVVTVLDETTDEVRPKQ